jgi:hypothetical protein
MAAAESGGGQPTIEGTMPSSHITRRSTPAAVYGRHDLAASGYARDHVPLTAPQAPLVRIPARRTDRPLRSVTATVGMNGPADSGLYAFPLPQSLTVRGSSGSVRPLGKPMSGLATRADALMAADEYVAP